MINKIGRVYHNANLSKLPFYKNAFLFVILSIRFQKSNWFLICLLSWKIKRAINELSNWAVVPKTEGKSSKRKGMELLKKSVMVELYFLQLEIQQSLMELKKVSNNDLNVVWIIISEADLGLLQHPRWSALW